MQFTLDDIVYVIPGIICVATYCFLVPGMKKPALEKLILAGFIISFFEFIVFSSGRVDAVDNTLFRSFFTSSGNRTVWMTLYNLFVFFLLPVLLAVAAMLLSKWRAFRRWFNLSHPIPTAWDYKLSSIRDARYVILTMDNGNMFYGVYDGNSFAASTVDGNDIHLSRTFNEDWEPTETNDGLWVRSEDIKYMEFIKTIEDMGKSKKKTKQGMITIDPAAAPKIRYSVKIPDLRADTLVPGLTELGIQPTEGYQPDDFMKSGGLPVDRVYQPTGKIPRGVQPAFDPAIPYPLPPSGAASNVIKLKDNQGEG